MAVGRAEHRTFDRSVPDRRVAGPRRRHALEQIKGNSSTPPTLPGPAPWEDLSAGRDHVLFAHTVRGLFLAPGTFFSQVGTGGDLIRPWVFGVFCLASGTAMNQVYLGLGLRTGRLMPSNAGSSAATSSDVPLEPGSLLGFTIGATSVALIGVLAAGAVFHALLRLFGGGVGGFRVTLRVQAYLCGLALLNFVPFIGASVWPLWWVALEIVGLRRAHRDGFGPSLGAVLGPLVLLLLAAVLAPAFSR